MIKQLYSLLSKSWVNALLLCVPAGITLHAVSSPLVAVLVLNFLAAVGLHAIGDSILRSVTSRIGRRYGSLLYISVRYVGPKYLIVVILLIETVI